VGAVDVVDPATGAVDYMLHQYVGRPGPRRGATTLRPTPASAACTGPTFRSTAACGAWLPCAMWATSRRGARFSFSTGCATCGAAT